MRPRPVAGVLLAVARERRPADVPGRLAGVVGEQEGVALARVWLRDVDGGCAACPADAGPALHLVASAGTPADAGAAWTRTDGRFHRAALGAGKIGKVGGGGAGLLLHDMSARSAWIEDPAWAAREGIRSVAVQPLACDGAVLGVLAAFSRGRIDADGFAWLRAVADQGALALAAARRAAEREDRLARLEAENACLRDAAAAACGGTLAGVTPAARRLAEQVRLAAASDATVLVTGEPGTGKELVARRIHAESRRRAGPFLTLACADGSPDALARALVGRAGRLVAAAGGTLFLDEVGGLPLAAQRALEDALADRAPDVRVVAATARDLAAEVADGRFRADLRLRLSVLTIAVPPLRERPADLAPLVEHLLDAACRRRGRPRPVLAPRELRALERHAWPGNARELAAAVERAVAAAPDGRVRFDLAAPAREGVVAAADWRRRERANLEAALARAGGRIYGTAGAAALLGVPPTTLASRVKALGIARLTRTRSRGSAAP